MGIIIDLQNDAGFLDTPDDRKLSSWVTAALQKTYDNLEQTIRVVDEAEIKALNLQFRGQDKPTNILSFPAEIPHIDYQCLGDLVICAPIVAHEATDQNKSLEAHWAHLIVHGMLHLQGFDHQIEQDAEEMEALEIKILATLSYPNPYNRD